MLFPLATSKRRLSVPIGLLDVGQGASQSNRITEGAKNTRERPDRKKFTNMAIGTYTMQTM